MIALDIALAAGVPILSNYFGRVSFAAGAAVIAVATFFLFWLARRDRSGSPSSNSMRDAIAVAFVVTYLVMVAWAGFFSEGAHGGELPALTQTLVSNFTILTGVVVASYFGADAVKQVAQLRQLPSDPSDADKKD